MTKKEEEKKEELQIPEEPKVNHEKKPLEFQEKIENLIPTAGTISLEKSEHEALYGDIDENTVEIRPDGLIYLPWMEYVTRLKKAFGLQWAIIPQGMPKVHDTYIYWPFYLVIQGKLAGFAIGEQEYIPSNPIMSYGDCCEGAKSNALMRLCKGIGIGLELWQPSFIQKWKAKYAESYHKRDSMGQWITDKYGRKKLFWRKKGEKVGEAQNNEAQDKEVNSASIAQPEQREYERKAKEGDINTLAGFMQRKVIEAKNNLNGAKDWIISNEMTSEECIEMVKILKKTKELQLSDLENELQRMRKE